MLERVSDLMSILRTLTAVLLAAGVSAPGLAQGPPLAITLEEATARAVQNSHRLGELRARAEGAAAAEAGRRAADLPSVGLLGGYSRTNHVEEFTIAMPGQPSRVLYPDVPDNYHARVDLQWPIYTAGRLAALERAAGGERAAAELDVEAARADARLEAARAFWALVTAGETEETLAKALESTEAHVRDLRSRLDQGLIPPNEVLSAEAQLSRQRVLAIEARNLRGVAEADLRRVIGEDSRTSIQPVVLSGEPTPIDPRSADPEALSQEARGLRPERRALASRVSAAQERRQAAAASGLPQVSIGAGYDYARPNPRIFPRVEEWRDSWDVSVNVSWALWDGGRRKAEEAEAAAGGRALAARAAEFDRQLAFELEQRRLDADSAHAAIAAADDGVRAAVEARRVLGERFAAGVATSTEVLDADTAVLQARLDRTRAISAARLARARLDRAIGR
jgi:outer membrane protein TolC